MENPVLPYNRTVGTHGQRISRERENRPKRRRSGEGKSAPQSEGVTGSELKVAKYPEDVPRKAAIVYKVPVP